MIGSQLFCVCVGSISQEHSRVIFRIALALFQLHEAEILTWGDDMGAMYAHGYIFIYLLLVPGGETFVWCLCDVCKREREVCSVFEVCVIGVKEHPLSVQ
jgi:hypothetical protein